MYSLCVGLLPATPTKDSVYSLVPASFVLIIQIFRGPSMPFNVLVVASEKELAEFVPLVQAAKKYVGPIRIFKEHRSVQACEQAQVSSGASNPRACGVKRSCSPPKMVL